MTYLPSLLLRGVGSPREVPKASGCSAGLPGRSLRPLATEIVHGDRPHGLVLHSLPSAGSGGGMSGEQFEAPAGSVPGPGPPLPPEKTTAMPASWSFLEATFIGSRASHAPPPGP